ncbi:GGDEF domain-containing protein [Sulfuricella sp. T08]|uniref:GGDEF domain-containing protein n=1 Tax=Sulfuricella sp. T08 TaxID=1632857 RepID=UPI000750BFAC|nr:GGDEF domain-containing protein [Sulfuricella sp. T08]
MHKLTEEALPPTPENYAKAYYEISGTQPPQEKVSNERCTGLLEMIREMLVHMSEKTGSLASDLQTGNREIKQSLEDLCATEEKARIQQLLNSIITATGALNSCVEDTHEDIIASRLTMEHIQEEMKETRQWLQEDTLTGAQNRRGMDMALTREIARAKRNKTSLSMAMLDIDHFKRINDKHGHDAGDAMLVHLSTVIKSVMREADVLVRYGGEEFLIVLPDSDIRGANFVIDRLRQVIQKSPMIYEGKRIEATFSGGLAQLKPDENGHSLLLRADKALYEAKQSGRNRFKIAE